MALFGNPQTTSVFAQSVQMLSQALDRSTALELQRQRQEHEFAMRQNQLDIKQKSIEAQERLHELEYNIKTAQLKKIEAEAQRTKLLSSPERMKMQDELEQLNLGLKRAELADKTSMAPEEKARMKQNKMRQEELDTQLKEAHVADQVFKSEQLTLASEDPHEYSRSFQSVPALARESARLQSMLSDPYKALVNNPHFSAEAVKEQYGQVQKSLAWRTEQFAKRYSRTREEAARDIEPEPMTEPAQAAQAGQAAVAANDVSLPQGGSSPPQADYPALLRQLQDKDSGIVLGAKQAIRRQILDSQKAKTMARTAASIKAALPGTEEEKQKAFLDILKSLNQE